MAKLVDAGLQREAEGLFASTDEILIAAFHVLKVKQQGESTGTQLLKALGGKTFLAKEAPQPRLLCLTVRRSKTTRGFKPSLHIRHPPDASRGASGASHHAHTASAAAAAAATKSYPLKTLTEILVPASKYEHNPAHLLELHFSGTGAYSNARGEVVNQLKLRSGEELMLVLALLLALLRQNNYRLPALSGADAGEVQGWWLGQAAAVLPLLGPFAAEVLLPGGEGGGGEGSGGPGGGGSRVLLSAKEERDLEELLDMFAMGVGDVAEFEARLAAEHEALEAANVHTIMSTKPAADAVVFAIKKTQSMLEDLDETLLVFDTKLRHMREDIAAIEASNNRLELSARNNTKLLHSLQELLSDLALPPDTAALLEAPPFAAIAAAAASARSDRGPDGRLAAVCRAAWSLAAALRRLDPGGGQGRGLSPYLLQMRVAQEARESLTSLAGRFTAAALAHLRALYAAGVEEVLGALAAGTDKAAKLVPPPHDRLRTALWRHAELVRCVAALERGGGGGGSSMTRLAVSYCQPLNMLLRKELRISVAELRKAASLDMQANPIDYGLTSSSNRLGGGGGAAGAGGAGAGSVMGSGRGPAGSVVGTSVVGSSEDAGEHDDVRSLAPSDHLGLGAFAGGPLSSASRQSRSTFRSIVSRTGGGTYDPFNMAIPLHEAWQGLLEGYLPHLLAEAESAAAVLLLHRGDMRDLIPPDALLPPPPDPDEDPDASGGGGRRRRGKSGRSGGGRSRSRARAEEAAAAAALTAAAAAGGGGGEGGGGGGGPERPLSRTGRQVVDALLSGCDADFMVLVDLTAKSHQVLCLPMMALASRCIAALAPRGPVAAPLQLLLAHCHARLGANLAKWVEAQRAAVEAYGARLAGAGSVKSHHVVNFISQFALMAHHIEVMLSETPDALIEQLSGGAAVADPATSAAVADGRRRRGGAGGSGSSTGRGGRGGGDGGGSGNGNGRAAGGGGGEGEDEEEEEDEEARQRRELVQQAASWQARPEVDSVYSGLVGLMFGALERVAASDTKHGDRLRAENYGYFVEAVRPLVRHVAALEPAMVQAEAKMEESLSRYVRSQLAYTNLWKLLEASERMDQLLQVVSPAEVPYQAGFSAADVRALLSSSLKDVDKKVQRMYARVKKHLGNSNLAYRVWERLYEQLVERYSRLDQQLAACYPALQLSPGLEELQDVFRSVGPQSATSP
ncbi:hypothetical protein CHLRE_09g392000v5 [Chlamydomonas reinhardtii]|uniref:Exocyst complex component Sec3 C-terminal domain-containing protein n=1 Tax=Chlamydomonas reinhardtii TaxID=3055 RepID=A0A2K3DDH0_CHLRE|nr:uncharacterized protein CHLRE_09g392000v5 [Chlamydomonas reinhardtii]PNW78567.1 hypothetical protein CHLRE_09g392000v5 [Chlamydomonas reinhardtii]